MATRVKSLANPRLITWARETIGLTIPEAAAKLDIDEDRLAKWENNDPDDRPSIPQLRKIAALFKRPLAVFYMAEPPTRFSVMRDLRRLPGTDARRYSPALEIEIRAANERRELALELASDLQETLSSFSLTATDREDPDGLGKGAGEAFGVPRDLKFHGATTTAVPLSTRGVTGSKQPAHLSFRQLDSLLKKPLALRLLPRLCL